MISITFGTHETWITIAGKQRRITESQGRRFLAIDRAAWCLTLWRMRGGAGQ
jgi:hypothetical protein